MEHARDRFWLWGHDAGSHDNGWNIPGPSRMTPVEGAYYMGIQNVIMIRYGAESQPPSRRYAVPFRALKKVVWSIVGGGGVNTDAETSMVLEELPHYLPNLTGVMMDDFFMHMTGDGPVGAMPLDKIRNVTARLGVSGRKLDLWVVLYGHQLNPRIVEYLNLCDKVAFWTWEAAHLEDLEKNFAAMEALVPPSCGKVLGCYMWDYGQHKPMPLKLMQKQCTLGLKWLQEGRIEGMIFLASCICDLDLETVEWTRRWIARVGGKRLKPGA